MLILTTLNSQYVHTNLALKYLGGVARNLSEPYVLMEFTINESLDEILRRIFERKPEMVAFSCYIWNIQDTVKVMKNLRKVLPEALIVVGGPEVSYDSLAFLEEHPYVDVVVCGEGEKTFEELLTAWRARSSMEGIAGLTWWRGREAIKNPDRLVLKDLDSVPLAYGTEPLVADGRIVYYETSRGCPFNCSYCLSSTVRGVRFIPDDRIKHEIKTLVAAGVEQVKFVDRSFNCRPDRALEIMRFLADLSGQTSFHFEIMADLLDEETWQFLATVKPGLFQFEIGVQSTNPETLAKINRNQDLQRLAENLRVLQQAGRIRIHLDLIAGRPEEDMESLARSFNWTYELKPDYLQLGFLKLLKGTAIRRQSAQGDYLFKDYPPYEVLANRWLGFKDISLLKVIEDLLQKYYNSRVFCCTLNYCGTNLFPGNSFEFYKALADYWLREDLVGRAINRERLYVILFEFLSQLDGTNSSKYRQLLIMDFVINNRNLNIPAELGRMQIEKQGMRIKRFLADRERNMPGFRNKYRPRIEVFPLDILDLAGISLQEKEVPYYPVLFTYDEGVKLEYIDL
ncbi:MAG: DUF4080 domain-containing protein [Syntrophomonadaceae bacterium]|nr:DUF4080 domain-containing protein [Syntrophomonadaceae bacterium]